MTVTVGELIEKLRRYPKDMRVVVYDYDDEWSEPFITQECDDSSSEEEKVLLIDGA